MSWSSGSSEELLPLDDDVAHPRGTLSLDYLDPRYLSAIFQLILNDDLSGMKSILSSGKSPNVTDNRGNTPLHVAVLMSKGDSVDYLLSLDDISINAQNHYGETPLFIGTAKSEPSITLKLIAAKADVNISNHECITPLHNAVKRHSEVVLALLENGADINAQDYGRDTPLNEAVKDGTFEVVSMLLCYGADANIPCDNNLSPLMFSMINENYNMQEQLIEYDTNYNRTTHDGMSVLFLAITHQSPFTLELVLRGADIHQVMYPHNVLTMCIDSKQIDLFKELWGRIHYDLIWREKDPSILHLIIQTRCYELLKYVFESDKIQEVINHNTNERIILIIIRAMPLMKYSDDEIAKMIYTLLSYGFELDALELEHVFMMFGHNDLFRLMLHMDVKMLEDCGQFIIPNIIYDVRPGVTVKSMLDRYQMHQDSFEYLLLNIKCIVRHCVHQPLFQYFMQVAEINDFDVPVELSERLNCSVPSLLELSRNQVRCAICDRFQISSARHFYTYIQCLKIPTVIKDMISFKVPVYRI